MANKQIRRVTLPVAPLLDYLLRTQPALSAARIQSFQVEPRTKQIHMYLETPLTEAAQPLAADVNWNEVFGFLDCPNCGVKTGVETIVTCTACSDKLPKAPELVQKTSPRRPPAK